MPQRERRLQNCRCKLELLTHTVTHTHLVRGNAHDPVPGCLGLEAYDGQLLAHDGVNECGLAWKTCQQGGSAHDQQGGSAHDQQGSLRRTKRDQGPRTKREHMLASSVKLPLGISEKAVCLSSCPVALNHGMTNLAWELGFCDHPGQTLCP
eukprot:scaffold52078_cov19-Tisochrysis_lutea.AAC.1